MYLVNNKGSLKRCGGIGDILSGIISSLVSIKKKSQNGILKNTELLEICAIGCYLCREISYVAYNKNSYSLTAPDIIHELKNYTKHLNL